MCLKKIIAIYDFPQTKSEKIIELAVEETIDNDIVNNFSSLENPEILHDFQNWRRFFAWPFRAADD